MLRLLAPALALALTLTLPAVLAEDARGAQPDWRMPLREAEVKERFLLTPASPYAAGQRRGVDLAARPGAAVRSACTGRVSFAAACRAARARSASACAAAL
jgi:murein DD-endopeptidase MepM/ murein hydrolase activator NlpD